jgi:hypothetical protein
VSRAARGHVRSGLARKNRNVNNKQHIFSRKLIMSMRLVNLQTFITSSTLSLIEPSS